MVTHHAGEPAGSLPAQLPSCQAPPWNCPAGCSSPVHPGDRCTCATQQAQDCPLGMCDAPLCVHFDGLGLRPIARPMCPATAHVRPLPTPPHPPLHCHLNCHPTCRRRLRQDDPGRPRAGGYLPLDQGGRPVLQALLWRLCGCQAEAGRIHHGFRRPHACAALQPCGPRVAARLLRCRRRARPCSCAALLAAARAW